MNKVFSYSIFLLLVVVNTLLVLGCYLVAVALTVLPVYIYGYGNLTQGYKEMVFIEFLVAGILCNLIEVGRKKKRILYQLAWSLYVAALMGFIGLIPAFFNDHTDKTLLINVSYFYGAYLLAALMVIRIFKIKFQYFSRNT